MESVAIEEAEKAFLDWLNSLSLSAEKLTDLAKLGDGALFIMLLNRVYFQCQKHVPRRDPGCFPADDYQSPGSGAQAVAANLKKLNERINKYLTGCLNIVPDGDGALDVQAIARDGDKRSIIRLVTLAPTIK